MSHYQFEAKVFSWIIWHRTHYHLPITREKWLFTGDSYS